jgi:hypothetical protein
MRHLCTSIALLAPLALLAGAASGAPRQAGAPPRSLRSASASFQDATGDDPGGPDITTVTLSCDDAGNLSLQVAVPNRPSFASDMELMVGFNSDGNAGAGATDIGGSDYLVIARPGPGAGTTQASVGRWNGVRFSNSRQYPSLFRYEGGLGTITVNRSEIGGTGKFDFFVAVASNIDFANDDFDNLYEDDAPDAGVWTYDTGLQPIAQPAATRLLARQTVLVPTKPRPASRSSSGSRCRRTPAPSPRSAPSAARRWSGRSSSGRGRTRWWRAARTAPGWFRRTRRGSCCAGR